MAIGIHRSRKVQEEIASENPYYKQFYYFWWILKVTGYVPFKNSKNGDITVSWFSFEFLYSVVVYAIMFYPVKKYFEARLHSFASSDTPFEDKHTETVQMTYSLLFFLMPWLSWFEFNKMEKLFTKWKDFQVDYEEITVEKIKFLGHFSVLWKYVLCMMFVLILSFVYTIEGEEDNFVVIGVVKLFIAGTQVTNGFLQYSSVDFNLQTVVEYKKQLRKAIQNGRYELLAAYSVLWVRLADICRNTGSTYYKIQGALMLTFFIGMTMSSYSTVLQLTQGFMWKRTASLGMFLFAAAMFLTMCVKNHTVSNQLGEKLVNELSRCSIRVGLQDQHFHDEMETFINCIKVIPYENSAYGYFNYNRPLFVSVLSTLLTYLIVMVQFSFDQDDESIANTTAPTGDGINYTSPGWKY